MADDVDAERHEESKAPSPLTAEIACSLCSLKRESRLTKSGKPRIPRGWKEIGSVVYCQKCKGQKFAIRAVSIPVAACDWNVVMPILKSAWKECVSFANWFSTQLYMSDSLSVRSDKLPSWKAPYLYNEVRKRFPGIEPTSIVPLINSVQGKYRASRWDLWRGATSLPTYRSMPLPISAQAWKLEITEPSGSYEFSFRAGGERHSLTLRSGSQFARQHDALRQIVSGEIEPGEASLYQQGDSLMLNIPAWFPKQERAGHKTIKARTCTDGFLVANDGEQIWRLNADHVQRWIVGSEKQQSRLREDLKSERRFPRSMRKGIVDRMGELSTRRKGRLDSWIHESAHQLVQWARRRGAISLVWDDSYPSMFAAFPWFIFAERISQKCEIAGIEFVRASEGAATVAAQPLAMTTGSKS